METIALEWVGSSEVEPWDVVKFVQQLDNVPQDAVCEIGDIFSRRYRAGSKFCRNQEEVRIQSEVYLTCEPSVVDFLCKKFGTPTQHVLAGEVISVKSKRVYPGVKPLGKLVAAAATGTKHTTEGETSFYESIREDNTRNQGASVTTASVLSIDKVIALLDLLGDQVVDAQEAYDFFADSDAPAPQRMTLLGLSKALAKLSKDEWTAWSSSRRLRDKTESTTIEGLRYLLSKLITTNNVGIRSVPPATTTPFLSYTDFLACYVAFLSSLHSST